MNSEIKDQISLFLNIYEQQRKVEAKRVKEARSRAAINGVNSRTQEQLQELNNIADEEQAADSAKKFDAAIERCLKKAEEANKQYELLGDRSKKCDELLPKYDAELRGNVERSTIVKTCKRTVAWGLNNAHQGTLNWEVACEERNKIRRLCPDSDEGRAKLAECDASFNALFQRIVEHDLEQLQQPLAELAFAVRDHEEADEWTTDWVDRIPSLRML